MPDCKGHRDDAAELLGRCIDGDGEAWEEFVRRYTGLIRHAIVSRLEACGVPPRQHDVSDILQDVFVALAGDGRRRLRSLRDRSRPEAWLCIVARNIAADWMRHRRGELLTDTGELPDRPTSPGSDQRTQVHRTEIRKALADLFGELTPREQIILRLAYNHGLKRREIAQAIGVPIGTVTSTMTRANAKLRERLRRRFPEDLPQ